MECSIPSPVALIDSSQEASLTYDLIPSSAPKVDPLPEHLRYEFLGSDNTYPVIVSSRLTPMEIDRLLEILRRYRAVIGYSIDDTKGISPTHASNLSRG